MQEKAEEYIPKDFVKTINSFNKKYEICLEPVPVEED